MTTVTIIRKWHTIPEVAEMLGFGLSMTKFLVLSGGIRSVKDGRHRRILAKWVDDYVRRVAEQQAPAAQQDQHHDGDLHRGTRGKHARGAAQARRDPRMTGAAPGGLPPVGRVKF